MDECVSHISVLVERTKIEDEKIGNEEAKGRKLVSSRHEWTTLKLVLIILGGKENESIYIHTATCTSELYYVNKSQRNYFCHVFLTKM